MCYSADCGDYGVDYVAGDVASPPRDSMLSLVSQVTSNLLLECMTMRHLDLLGLTRNCRHYRKRERS